MDSGHLACFQTVTKRMKANKCLDFFVIGTMKAGTTSVHKYMSAHPDIYLPPEKEAPFFSEDDAYLRGFGSYWQEYFSSAKDNALLGTVTPDYMRSPQVPSRIHETCPDAKLIAILRNPIERAYSHYLMATRVLGENRNFEEAISEQLASKETILTRDDPNYYKDYISLSEYGKILSGFYKLFPPEQVLILYLDELNRTPEIFMSKIFQFLGVQIVAIPNLRKKYHGADANLFLSKIAHLMLNTRLRFLGKLMLPEKLRRRLRFWIGLHRVSRNAGLNTDYRLMPDTRANLEKLYRQDAEIIRQLTGKYPDWIKEWNLEIALPDEQL